MCMRGALLRRCPVRAPPALARRTAARTPSHARPPPTPGTPGSLAPSTLVTRAPARGALVVVAGRKGGSMGCTSANGTNRWVVCVGRMGGVDRQAQACGTRGASAAMTSRPAHAVCGRWAREEVVASAWTRVRMPTPRSALHGAAAPAPRRHQGQALGPGCLARRRACSSHMPHVVSHGRTPAQRQLCNQVHGTQC